MLAGRTDYFTGIARKDLFSRFLVPSKGNLRKPLVYLLNNNALASFIPCEQARTIQQRYNSATASGVPDNVRLSAVFETRGDGSNGSLLSKDASLEPEITDLLRYEINKLYTRLIANSAHRNSDGTFELLDNGSTYCGCGAFVLSGDKDNAGGDRPYLLLEKRWKVSEENDNLSYPSGGSCDLYTPDDNIPQDLEELKALEADPFKTAARELREEINILLEPGDLQLISLGIDVNRNLQQFSFLYESDEPARRILERARYAGTPREGFTFYIPFQRQAILSILNNYQMESGAVYSLMRITDIKADRLWS
jgi:hypothetical protein